MVDSAGKRECGGKKKRKKEEREIKRGERTGEKARRQGRLLGLLVTRERKR